MGGPLGVEFKNNVKNAWHKKFVQENPYNVALDSAILMNPQVWVASGHVGGFSDPLMDCKDCKTRHRADKLIEDAGGDANGMTFEQMSDYIKEHGITCPECGSANFTDIRKFNLMFKTFPASGNCPGHLRKLCQYPAHYQKKASFRRLPDRKILPQ